VAAVPGDDRMASHLVVGERTRRDARRGVHRLGTATRDRRPVVAELHRPAVGGGAHRGGVGHLLSRCRGVRRRDDTRRGRRAAERSDHDLAVARLDAGGRGGHHGRRGDVAAAPTTAAAFGAAGERGRAAAATAAVVAVATVAAAAEGPVLVARAAGAERSRRAVVPAAVAAATATAARARAAASAAREPAVRVGPTGHAVGARAGPARAAVGAVLAVRATTATTTGDDLAVGQRAAQGGGARAGARVGGT